MPNNNGNNLFGGNYQKSLPRRRKRRVPASYSVYLLALLACESRESQSPLSHDGLRRFTTHARGHARASCHAGRPAGGKTEQGLFLSSSVTRSRFKSLHGSTREAEEARSTKQERRLRFRAQTRHNAVVSAPFLESPCTWSSPLPCCDYYKKRVCTYEKVEYIVRYGRRESVRWTKCRVLV